MRTLPNALAQLLLSALLLSVGFTTTRAQNLGLEHTLTAPDPSVGHQFGFSVAGVPDADGDGHGDLLVGTRETTAQEGRAYLYSGTTGALLIELQPPDPLGTGSFGWSVAGVPDADGDGRGDLLVGAYEDGSDSSVAQPGRAYLFSGTTGALLFELRSPDEEEGGEFGLSVAGVPDTDGDGHGDLLVGAHREGDNGRTYLYSGATGSLLFELQLPSNGETGARFGEVVASTPDVDGDGRGDLLVGEDENHRVYLYSGATGALLADLGSPNSSTPPYSRSFGDTVAGVPDIDGDGRGDLLIGASDEFSGGFPVAGRVYLFSGASGDLLVEFDSPDVQTSGDFGESVAGVFNADGGGGILIGAFREDVNGGEGKAYYFSTSAAQVQAQPRALDFGSVAVGDQSPPKAVVVQSVSSDPLTVEAFTLSGSNPEQFEVTSTPAVPFVLAPADSFTVEVAFTPTQTGLFEAMLVIETSTGDRRVPLSGFAREVGSSSVFVVTKTADSADGVCDADCSLREAIAAANATAGADTVLFAPSLDGQIIQSGGFISDDLLIDAEGQDITLNSSISIAAEVAAEITGITLDGRLTNRGTLLVRETTVRRFVPCINNYGTLTLLRSTVTECQSFSTTGGAGIFNRPGAVLSLEHSTFFDNFSLDDDGFKNQGTLTISNSTIPSFLSSSVPYTVSNSIINFCGSRTLSQGHNVFNRASADCPTPSDVVVDSELTLSVLAPELADNGGPTPTLALRAPSGGNPAVDIGGECGPLDQRSFDAPADGELNGSVLCDAGALEFEGAPQPVVDIRVAKTEASPDPIPREGGPYPFAATLVNTTAQTQTVQAWSEITLSGFSGGGRVLAFGPVRVQLAPSDTLARELVQRVPPRVPFGHYTYTGFVGDFPNAPIDSSSFSAYQAFVNPRMSSEAEWTAANWSVVDALTGGAVTAETVWSSDEQPETVAAATAVPEAFALAAFPNPFRETATLRLDVPAATPVRLTVYDVLGRAVAVLVDEELEAGSHALAFTGRSLPSGVYLLRMEAGSFVATQRLTLVR